MSSRSRYHSRRLTVKLVVIEDATMAVDKVREALGSSPHLGASFELDQDLSSQIRNMADYHSKLDKIGEIREGLALLLDLKVIASELWNAEEFPREQEGLNPKPEKWEEDFI